MYIYIVINETNYPIGTFIEIQDARDFKNKNVNCKIIKSNLVGNLPNQPNKDKNDLQESFKNFFGMLQK